MIGLRGVSKRFGDTVVLAGFDLALAEGGVTALMGANGSGKTTAMNVLLGLLAPDAGTVEVPPRTRFSAVFQEDRLCPQLTAAANVRLVLDRAVGQDELVAELARAGLDEASAHKPVAELSGGQARRVAIVRAMLAGAEVVCLDEPFKGLDAQGKERVMAYVRERLAGRTALLITHDAAEARWFGAPVQVVERAGG